MVKSRKEQRSESKALSINHPNSRKAIRLAKQVIREAARNKSKMNHAMKRNIVGEKLLWFQKNLDPNILVYTSQQLNDLIEKYIARNDEELEQIQLKHSIGQRKGRQHANREDVIKITKERELEEFNGSGIEMVDILMPKMLESFRKWEGNFGRLSLMKMKRFSKVYLDKYKPLPVSKDLMDRQTMSRRGSVDDEESEEDHTEAMDEDDEDCNDDDSATINNDNKNVDSELDCSSK